ncbi:hypothetical protein ATANTOWER_016205 [Ataeniobius toweri]|uniref:Uncharacterized protein n=1 Tax=Ataeniobius toweri TaxID=208326 RepID=A0ABU7CKR0_9TELE|nr:hypothetical protein [Ataeniobius toweri]
MTTGDKHQSLPARISSTETSNPNCWCADPLGFWKANNFALKKYKETQKQIQPLTAVTVRGVGRITGSTVEKTTTTAKAQNLKVFPVQFESRFMVSVPQSVPDASERLSSRAEAVVDLFRCCIITPHTLCCESYLKCCELIYQ